jgi:solute carrier family 66 (lysosomal lysine-arginine transporter), member 1
MLIVRLVVFSPQIIENWRRSSADGLSVVFITVWLLGDFFNIFGAVLQGVLPTMIILAVYYTFADIVLLIQCFWYKGFTLRDEVKKPEDERNATTATEASPLLSEDRQPRTNGLHTNGYHTPPRLSDIDRRHSSHSQGSFRERYLSIDATHLSPVTPLLDSLSERRASAVSARPNVAPPPSPQSTVQTVLFNLGTIILVCAAGVFGWWLSASRSPPPKDDLEPEPLTFNLWGQIFGYICAILYLGSRIPQLLLNYRRKSTEGISMLFFLFACIGNLTYVLSIVAYKPICKERRCEAGETWGIYGRYIAVNFSWLLGSFGTLLLDAGVFVQYFLYKERDDDEVEEEEEEDLMP